jgi:hypothetical protein
VQCDAKGQLLLPHPEVPCDANTDRPIDQPTQHTDDRQATANDHNTDSQRKVSPYQEAESGRTVDAEQNGVQFLQLRQPL